MITRDQRQQEKAVSFVALHKAAGAFVIPNSWDAGSARILAAVGFEALATTSAGLAFALGRRDAEGLLSRDDALANAAVIVQATDLPVSADLEDGFGPRPEDVAETIRQAAAIGLVGCTIEDTTADPAHPIHGFSLSVERVSRRRGGRQGAAFSVHVDGAGRELSFRPPRSRRHDPPIARVRGCRCQRPLRTGSARPRRDPERSAPPCRGRSTLSPDLPETAIRWRSWPARASSGSASARRLLARRLERWRELRVRSEITARSISPMTPCRLPKLMP